MTDAARSMSPEEVAAERQALEDSKTEYGRQPVPIDEILNRTRAKLAARKGQIEAPASIVYADNTEDLLEVANRRRIERLEQIPPRHSHVNLDHLDVLDLTDADKRALRSWPAAFLSSSAVQGLLFVGPSGRGKTGVMWAIYSALVDRDFDGRSEFAKVVRLLVDLRDFDKTAAITKRLVDIDLLFLDDLGAQKDTEWTDERLYEILDSRYDYCRPTIISTNVVEAEFTDAFGPRIASRLKGQAFHRINFLGQDLRDIRSRATPVACLRRSLRSSVVLDRGPRVHPSQGALL